jgi:hypothetical protein
MTPDQELMSRVGRICGPLFDAISPQKSPTTSFPKSFIMALTAGETGQWLINNAEVPIRFEPSIYAALLDVQRGSKKNYGEITTAMLASTADAELRDYASSWGLTQILGYITLAWKEPLSLIQNPATHYNGTLRLLGEFERSFWLDPTKDFEEFARCWNSGSPHGKTYDPNYANNLIERMAAWEGF